MGECDEGTSASGSHPSFAAAAIGGVSRIPKAPLRQGEAAAQLPSPQGTDSTTSSVPLRALVNMISNLVNSTVPIAAEVFKKAGTYDEKKLFGVTTLDVVRAKTFYAGKAGVPVTEVNVPVVGGHAGITILPLFSQATPASNSLSQEDIKGLTKRTQDGGTEVVEAKAGKGSATLSMAYAGAVFAYACLKGLSGAPDIVECSYVQSTMMELPCFASKVRLGKNGVEEMLGLGELSAFDEEGLENLKGELKSSIKKGIKFAQSN